MGYQMPDLMGYAGRHSGFGKQPTARRFPSPRPRNRTGWQNGRQRQWPNSEAAAAQLETGYIDFKVAIRRVVHNYYSIDVEFEVLLAIHPVLMALPVTDAFHGLATNKSPHQTFRSFPCIFTARLDQKPETETGHASRSGARVTLTEYGVLQATKHVVLVLELFKPALDVVLREINKVFKENEMRKPPRPTARLLKRPKR